MLKRFLNWYNAPKAAEFIMAGQEYYLHGGRAYPRQTGELARADGVALRDVAPGQRIQGAVNRLEYLGNVLRVLDQMANEIHSKDFDPSTLELGILGLMDDIAYQCEENIKLVRQRRGEN